MNKSTLLVLMLSASSAILQAESSKIVGPAPKFKKVEAPVLNRSVNKTPVKQMTQEKSAPVVETSTNEVEVLQKQIESLQKQLETIAKQVNDQSKQVKEIKTEHKQVKESQPIVSQAVVKEEAKTDTPVFDKGYIAVPGTTAAVKISGMVRLDAIYDGKTNTGDFTNMANLPYRLQTRNNTIQTKDYAWNKHYNMHAKQTKIGINSVIKNSSGKDLGAFVEFDLYGTSSNGDSYPTYGTSTATASLSHTPRLRHATVNYGGLMAGHTWTNFFCFTETVSPTVDFGSLNGSTRHAQVRYTHTMGQFEAAIAAEQPRADYVTYNSAPAATAMHYAYIQQSTSTNISKSARPDITFSLKYKADNGSIFGLGLVSRDLTIQNNSTSTARPDGKTYKANGYGANLAAKIMTMGKSYVTAGVTFGKGIGWYIGELNGRSAYFDISDTAAASSKRVYKVLPMRVMWAGYSHVWNDQWQTTIGGARIDLFSSASIRHQPTQWFEPGLDSKMSKFCLNTIYKPESNVEVGLEYMFLKRVSVLKYKGEGSRYQLAISYKF